MSKSRASDAPPEKRSKGSGFGRAIGGFFRFLFSLALLGAVGYNTYTLMQMRAELDLLKQQGATTAVSPRPSAKNRSEPGVSGRRPFLTEASAETPSDPVGQTVSQVKKQFADLSARVVSLFPSGGSPEETQAALPAPPRPSAKEPKGMK
ncbi:MAG: hypothetical protein SFU56_17105 [Capsulimonadales bacterium]|nr:hypothetical protein [Capsulimonadales bacterium]